MKNLRKYGKTPFSVAVVHGGPGAGGEMAPVARKFSYRWGVLEPIQTATSLDGQIEELKGLLEDQGDPPLVLIGFSWGAWLSYVVATHCPAIIRKLILVGSGPFEEKYVRQLEETRQSRLTTVERMEFKSVIRALGSATTEDSDSLLARLGTLASKTDAYDPISDEQDQTVSIGNPGEIFRNVWKDAVELRRSGKLLELGRKVRCPVTAIHGDYDPHPAEGVRDPLSSLISDFRFVLLKNCGHTPWLERQAREKFYSVLEEELLGL